MSQNEATTQVGAAPMVKPPGYLARWFLRYYRLVTAVVCLVLAALGYFIVLSPKLARTRTIELAELSSARAKREQLEQKLQYLVSLSDRRSKVRDEHIDQIHVMLPTGPGVPEFIADLEAIARLSQVTVEGIEIAKVEPVAAKTKGKGKEDAAPAGDILPAGVRALEASLAIAATSYGNLKTLLGNIEQSLRLLDVVALLYSPAAKSYTVTVRAYYLEE